ncbi:MAG: GTP-binding protein, partial [Verrucomicrobiota bacterium]
MAYRYFSHGTRKFIVADTPGHEQYTRNMATGASNAELAILMVDARKGVLPQTKRHAFIVSSVNVKHVVVAINKMDLVDFDQSIFDQIKKTFLEHAKDLTFDEITFIPMSALEGDNIVAPSNKTPWYKGPTLLSHLETVQIGDERQHDQPAQKFAMSVQWVNRPNLDFRGYCGTVASGSVSIGQTLLSLPARKKASVKTITTSQDNVETAHTGEAITITLHEEIDTSRGDVLAAEDSPCKVSNILKSDIIWMHEKQLVAGRQYIFKSASFESKCTLSKPKYKIDIHDYTKLPAKTLELNEIGSCELYLDRALSFLPYVQNKALGSFILIDPITNETIAMGMIEHMMRRAKNIFEQDMEIGRDQRAEIKNQRPCVIWMTGLSGAGKSTIANILEQKLFTKFK